MPCENVGARRPGGSGRAALVGLMAAGMLLAACSVQPDQPGTVTADEAQQLNEAAEMLDANSVDVNAVDAMAAPTTNESIPR